MDELEFRRRIYADPNTRDPDVIEASQVNSERKQFVHQIRELDNQLLDAASVQVPENLADKLIWQQRVSSQKQRSRYLRPLTAIAASVALLATVGLLTLVPHTGDINQQVLAHMSHVDAELNARQVSPDLTSINEKLSSFDLSMASLIDNVSSANYCYLNTVKSLHLIVNTESGLLSVFFIPNQFSGDLSHELKDETYYGQSVSTKNASIVVVGEKPDNITEVIESVTRNLRFSA